MRTLKQQRPENRLLKARQCAQPDRLARKRSRLIEVVSISQPGLVSNTMPFYKLLIGIADERWNASAAREAAITV
jgi:hypothetical protein